MDQIDFIWENILKSISIRLITFILTSNTVWCPHYDSHLIATGRWAGRGGGGGGDLTQGRSPPRKQSALNNLRFVASDDSHAAPRESSTGARLRNTKIKEMRSKRSVIGQHMASTQILQMASTTGTRCDDDCLILREISE